jgi:hypothetical protein
MDVPVRCNAQEALEWGMHLRVTLDGVPQERVLSYDTGLGEVVRFVVTRDGKPVRDPRQPDEWLTQTVRGRVEVESIDA